MDDDEDEDEDGDGDPDAPPAPAAPLLLTSASSTSASHCWPQPPPTSTGPISSGMDPLTQNALPAWETELQQHGSLQRWQHPALLLPASSSSAVTQTVPVT
ncbi:uncharacterized protein LOC143157214 [Aptenodytes patagonicus]|uniref:uncharacterized protein LOC143157214 n=1 Tax=Aptenodytes patagonicus TaxID=9234 RepID=UPI003F9F6C9D